MQQENLSIVFLAHSFTKTRTISKLESKAPKTIDPTRYSGAVHSTKPYDSK